MSSLLTDLSDLPSLNSDQLSKNSINKNVGIVEENNIRSGGNQESEGFNQIEVLSNEDFNSSLENILNGTLQSEEENPSGSEMKSLNDIRDDTMEVFYVCVGFPPFFS